MFNRKLRERVIQLTNEVWRLQVRLDDRTTICLPYKPSPDAPVPVKVVVEALLKNMGWKINVTPPRDGKIELIDKDS